MRKLYFLKTMLLLCAIVGGSLYGWATDVVAYTFATAQSSSNTAYASNYNVTISGLSWSVPGNQNFNGYVRIGGKSLSGIDRVIKSNETIPDELTKITFNHNGISNSNLTVNSIKLTVASNSDFSTVIEEITKTPSFSVGTSGSFDFTPGENDNKVTSWGANRYYKFSINVSNSSSSSNYGLDVKSIVFYKEAGGGSDPSISLGTTSVNAPETSVSTTSIEVTYNNLTNYTADVVFYEADGTTAATYDHSWLTAAINATTKNLDYSITANTGAARTAYLKVSATGDEGNAKSSLITITQAKKTVVSPDFNLDGGSYMLGTNITLSSEGNTVYYNLTTDGTTPGNPTSASTKYTAPIVLGSGKTIIKAIAYDTYGNASAVTTRTYTGIALASLPFSWTGTKTAGKDELAAETGVALSLGSNYADSNAPYRLKFDGVGKNVTIYTNEKPEMVYFTAKLYNAASTGSKIKVQGSADGINFDDIEEFTIKGSQNATFEFSTSNAFAATYRAVRLIMSSKDQNVGVGTICVSCIPITPAKTYTTLTSAYNLDFTNVSGLKAYIATEISGGSVQMTQVNKVPAGTGLVLKATTPGTAVIVPVFDGTGADDVSENKMVGSATATTAVAANGGYILSDGVFQPATAGDLPAGKAYLAIAVSSSRALTMSFADGEATGIAEIEEVRTVENENVYNLSGQRVAQPNRGLYIVNGRKVIVK